MVEHKDLCYDNIFCYDSVMLNILHSGSKTVICYSWIEFILEEILV